MKRVEIMAAQAIQQDILDAFALFGVPPHYTVVPAVHGRGNTTAKLGDAVWPEENFMMIIYCDEDVVQRIERSLELVKKKYDHEGIGCFVL
jgi:hypothetical protein